MEATLTHTILARPLLFFFDLAETAESNTEMMPPPLCPSRRIVGQLLWGLQETTRFPAALGFRAVRMFAPAGLHPPLVYLCQHSAGGEKHPSWTGMVINSDLVFGRKPAVKTDWQLSHWRFYTVYNKVRVWKEECTRERVSFIWFGRVSAPVKGSFPTE